MRKDLTEGNIIKVMLLFAAPMILGNMLQQFYNITDTLIVGRALGTGALAAVGSAYTLMTFLTSILIGLCMGSGASFSYYFGKKDNFRLKNTMFLSFILIGVIALVLNGLVMFYLEEILVFLRTPQELMEMMKEYTQIVFMGIFFVFLYNYFAYVLRAIGNSVVPLYFLGSTALLNVVLDLIFVINFKWEIEGAALATVISQAISGLGIACYTWLKEPGLRFHKEEMVFSVKAVTEVVHRSFTASVQQSVMNFGILMVQGLVNSFGPVVMAAFTAGVKIDTLAYMPAQEFGNAFSLFISQNFGGGRNDRIRQGMKEAVKISMLFCIVISFLVFWGARYLIAIFVGPGSEDIINTGAQYLQVEGIFYCGIGVLFLLYGFYRGVNRPGMSLLLTIISLGTRVILAYSLAPVESIGVLAIWWAIPIGWFLADMTGILYMFLQKKKIFGDII